MHMRGKEVSGGRETNGARMMQTWIAQLLLLFTGAIHGIHAQLQIVPPYPRNVYALEGTDVENTCVASDTENKTLPVRIAFMRQDKLGGYTNITDPRVTFKSRTELSGWKLLTTMHIRNVTENDDGANGSYECWVFKNGTVKKTASHGFSVDVIHKKNLPGIKVTADVVANLEENVAIACNVTYSGGESTTKVKEITWTKDGKILGRVRNPDPVEPFTIDNVEPEDGGTYTCHLHFELHGAFHYNITGNVVVSVKPGFVGDITDKKVKSKKGESAQFTCAARGYSLVVEWKRQERSEERVQCINGSEDSYNITRKDRNSPYVLTINDVAHDDEGKYFCCLPDNCSNSTNGCQEWTLQMEGAISSSTLQLGNVYLAGFTGFAGLVFMLFP